MQLGFERVSNNPKIAHLITLADQFIYSLTLWHIVSFALVFLFVIFFLILAVLTTKKTTLSMIFQMLSLGTLVVAPIGSYFLVEKLYKPTRIDDLTVQYLYYKDVAMLRGVVTNLSSQTLKECLIKTKGYSEPSGLFDYMTKLANPRSRGDKKLDFDLQPQKSYRFVVDQVGVKHDENLSFSISVRCR